MCTVLISSCTQQFYTAIVSGYLCLRDMYAQATPMGGSGCSTPISTIDV